MHLLSREKTRARFGWLRTSGDAPELAACNRRGTPFTPRRRRYAMEYGVQAISPLSGSTDVEIPLPIDLRPPARWTWLRSRGDVPYTLAPAPSKSRLAPRERRCTVEPPTLQLAVQIDPTRVGIHLAAKLETRCRAGWLHVSGDTPIPHPTSCCLLPLTPHRGDIPSRRVINRRF